MLPPQTIRPKSKKMFILVFPRKRLALSRKPSFRRKEMVWY